MTIYVQDPRGLSFTDWAEQFILDNQVPTLVPPTDGQEWFRWAGNLIQDTAIASCTPPMPTDFLNWQEWVLALMRCLES